MELNKLQRIGGVCAIIEGLIYLAAFVIYGAVLTYPEKGAGALAELNFLSDNYVLLAVSNLASYVLFGILLSVLVVALHQRLRIEARNVSTVTSVFGIIWVGLVIASGMISNIGLKTVIDMGSQNPENAMQIWSSVGIVSEGLGGGNEIVGGIWVLLLSMISLRGQVFSTLLGYLGILIGIAGVLTVYPLDLFTEIFGIGQLIWFLWLGIAMIRKPV